MSCKKKDNNVFLQGKIQADLLSIIKDKDSLSSWFSCKVSHCTGIIWSSQHYPVGTELRDWHKHFRYYIF